MRQGDRHVVPTIRTARHAPGHYAYLSRHGRVRKLHRRPRRSHQGHHGAAGGHLPITVQCSGDVPAANINVVTASDNCGQVHITHLPTYRITSRAPKSSRAPIASPMTAATSRPYTDRYHPTPRRRRWGSFIPRRSSARTTFRRPILRSCPRATTAARRW